MRPYAAILAVLLATSAFGQGRVVRNSNNPLDGISLIPMGNSRISRGTPAKPIGLRLGSSQEWNNGAISGVLIRKGSRKLDPRMPNATGYASWRFGQILGKDESYIYIGDDRFVLRKFSCESYAGGDRASGALEVVGSRICNTVMETELYLKDSIEVVFVETGGTEEIPVLEPFSEPIPFLREWKSRQGSTVLASFAGFGDEGCISLVNREHKTISVPVASLCEEDQKHARTLKAQYDSVCRYIRRKTRGGDVDGELERLAKLFLARQGRSFR